MFESMLEPTSSNVRHQQPDNVYHLYNTIAHSVKFLEDEEKLDLMDRIRRVAEFCGIKLLSWCLMTNHFHLLVYLPPARELSDEEFRERLALLHPEENATFFEGFIRGRAPKELSRRMCNIGMFMKMVKQNFTLAYNERTAHRGTMWEGPYKFKKIPFSVRDLSTVAAYQNLNPIRACMADDFVSYPWTSFAAATKGDLSALKGIEFVFGGFENRTNMSNILVQSRDELLAQMQAKMDADLETVKRERAEAVWRRRIAGAAAPAQPDPLTQEAMVAQVEARMERLNSDELHKELERLLGRPAVEGEVKMVRAMAADPEVKAESLARITGENLSLVKRLSLILQKHGIITREGTKRRSFWRVNLFR